MVKKILFQLHWLLGISAGLVLVLMGVTGAGMSYERELLRLFNPGVVSVEVPLGARVLTPDELIARLHQQQPQRVVEGLTLSARAEDAVKVDLGQSGARSETLYVDPYSGALLGKASGAGFFALLMKLHRWLAIPGGFGKALTGAATLCLLFLLLSGLYLRWPRQALNWRVWLTLDWAKKGRGFNWDLHAVAGTWLLLCYLVAALTGLSWSYDWYRKGVHTLLGETSAVRQGPGAPGGGRGQMASLDAEHPVISLDPLWSRFRREVADDYQRVSLHLPLRAGQPLEVLYLPRDAEHASAFNRMTLDTRTGEPLEQRRYRDKSSAQRLLASFYALHTGDYFGQAGRIAMLLASASMPLFFITGWLLYLDRRRNNRAIRLARGNVTEATGDGAWLIAFASQSGLAEQLAWWAAAQLQAAGLAAQVRALAELDQATLQQSRRALFIISTFGDGEAPDNARGFERHLLTHELPLGQLHYALLALGDNQYTQFCGFGRRVDAWLQRQGAQALRPRVEVDNGDKVPLAVWQQQLAELTGAAPQAVVEQPFSGWRLLAREQLNPGSSGMPTFLVRLQPPSSSHWHAGDLLEVLPCNDAALDLRKYSIASIAEDGVLELIVRREQRSDGTLGLCSGWLTLDAPMGQLLQARVRNNSSFHAPVADCPLLLIGSGSGLAGLRSLLKARLHAGRTRNWLVFGERNAAHDFYCRDELQGWLASAQLARLDLAFSRDQASKIYVQDRLREQAQELQRWLDNGAAIYVCGSLQGMAAGVDRVLREVLGDERVEQLLESGRYRRDVY